MHNDLQNFVVIKFKTCFIFYFWTCFGPLGIFLIWFQLFYKCIKCSTYLSNILLRRKLFIVNGCCHRLVYSSAPTIRPPRVWIPNLTFIYSHFSCCICIAKKNEKEAGFGSYEKLLLYLGRLSALVLPPLCLHIFTLVNSYVFITKMVNHWSKHWWTFYHTTIFAHHAFDSKSKRPKVI